MSFELKHKHAFIDILSSYQPSPETIKLLGNIPLVIIQGVSGSGKNTIINHLINTGKFHAIVSDTTRPPKVRDGYLEQNGVHYNFRSEDEVLRDLREGKFLEAELIHNQQVSGISVRELKRAAASGKIPITEVDIGGTIAIRRIKPDTKFFFVVPPSFKEWMYRLHGREVMSQQETNNRIATATHVLRQALQAKDLYFVVNDSSHRSAEMIDQQVHSSVDEAEQSKAYEAAQAIYEDLLRHTGTH